MKTQLPKAAYNLTGAAGRLVCCRSNYKVGGGRDREAQGLSLNLLGCSPAPTPATSPMELPLCQCSRASLLLPTAQASPTSTWFWVWISCSPGLWRKEEEVQNPGNWPWEAASWRPCSTFCSWSLIHSSPAASRKPSASLTLSDGGAGCAFPPQSQGKRSESDPPTFSKSSVSTFHLVNVIAAAF